MKNLVKLAGISALAFAVTACGHMDKQERRVAAGAAIGAVAGYAITGDATGAMAGAAVGGVAGNQYDHHREKKNQ
ncbi:glycine zipper domain-containing protein [Caviibacterium pharyngocola]|uniref:Glycine zipper domain-containing protein n=1 Tax=Caviibacterium pharyngocola TaxID=28159 RepID=A0A2M8RTQ4_9PAST|nr:glycine zipper domain-containing protein [Caviibacterium pharyngocola]PJG82265.1 hypothetical protein CVP04_09880 [Caviibacterium pharyngocola]